MKKTRFCIPIAVHVQKAALCFLLMVLVFHFGSFAKERNEDGVLNRKITVTIQNQKLSDALKIIGESANVQFSYRADLLPADKMLSLHVRNVTLSQALASLLDAYGVGFEAIENRVVLEKVESQNYFFPVSGSVNDAEGKPLQNVSVLVRGTNRGTITDVNGRFNIEAGTGDVLEFSLVGYKTVSVTIRNNEAITVSLQTDILDLSEVVVIGYGTVRQKNLTGAVSSVKARDLNTSVASNFQQALQGKAAGVQVVQSTGQPGAGVSVQIRSNPSFANAGVLYVIDGVPVNDAAGQPSFGSGSSVGGSKYGSGGVDKSPLNFINPNDIASIEFLKDASSASIYGARAGAGVVLITTKKGSEGKSVLNYTGSYGIQRVDKMYPVYNARDYMIERNLLREEIWYRDNKIAPYYGSTDPSSVTPYTPIYSQAEIDAAGNYGENATDAIVQNGYTQQHNLSLSGGNAKTSYFASGNYFDQKGVIIGTDYQRYNGRLSLNHIVSDKIRIGGDVILSNSVANNTITGGENENGGIVTAAIYWAPVVPLKTADGAYPVSPYYPNIPNPLSYATVTDKTKSNRVLSSAFGEWMIVSGLKARAKFSLDQSSSKRQSYFPRTFLYGSQASGAASISESSAQSKLVEYTLSYDKKLSERHSLNAVVGYTYQKTDWEGFNAANQNFLSDVSLYYDLASGQAARPSVGSNKSQTTWASYFGRAIYTFNGNVTLQASIRRDGASLFAVNKKWGYFPAVSAGWVISDENFMQGVQPISFLKLRAGYGETGNSAISSAAFAQYGTALSPLFGTGTLNSGLVLTRAANPNLTWETAGELNVGVDFGLFNNRVSGSFDYFVKTIRNLLTFVPYPSGFIINGVYSNAGKTRSNGYDIGLESRNVVASSKNGFSWTTNITFSHYLNYWVERSPEALAVLNKYEIATGKGALFNPIFGYISEGIYKGGGKEPQQMPGMLPGGIIVKDIHGYDASGNLTSPDGKITAADITYLGNADPKFNFGFGNQFNYKNFDLNIFMSGLVQKKWSPYASGRATENTMNSFGFNAMPVSSTRWTFKNPDGNFPTSLTDGTYNQYQSGSDYWLVDASFLRCRNISLGYSFPKETLGKQNVISGLRISFDVQNPFTITKYPGLDPELNTNNFYPLVKSYIIGINASF